MWISFGGVSSMCDSGTGGPSCRGARVAGRRADVWGCCHGKGVCGMALNSKSAPRSDGAFASNHLPIRDVALAPRSSHKSRRKGAAIAPPGRRSEQLRYGSVRESCIAGAHQEKDVAVHFLEDRENAQDSADKFRLRRRGNFRGRAPLTGLQLLSCVPNFLLLAG